MQIIITGRHLDLTDDLKTFINDKANKLTRYYDRLHEMDVVVSMEAGQHVVEFIARADHHHRFVAKERHGVLSTAHAELLGWPFGSLVPYALTPASDPVLLLSDIAEHTHNLAKDSRASLLVADPAAAERPQAGARVTVVGRCAVPAGAEGEEALSAYFGRFSRLVRIV